MYQVNFLKEPWKIGDDVVVTETTQEGKEYMWNAIITDIQPNYIQTKHCRNPITHPEWMHYPRAYSDVWIRHYH